VLNHARILVVEDEPFIALNLALAIEDAGGVVIGPAGSVKEALALLQSTPVAAAILDVNVADGDITPVLKILVGLGTPLIVQTGVGLPDGFPTPDPPIVVRIKPCVAEQLVVQLEALISSHSKAFFSSNAPVGNPTSRPLAIRPRR
jgi:DNA-binding NtrC family response regulator